MLFRRPACANPGHASTNRGLRAFGIGVFAAMLMLAAPAASAQILPNLPGGGIDDTISRGVEHSVVGSVTRRVEDTVDTTVQKTAERAADKSLMQGVDRALQKTMERLTAALDKTISHLPGPLGEPRSVPVEDNWRAVDHEWVVLVAPEQLRTLTGPGVQILSETALPSAGQILVRVLVSDQDNTPGRAQALLRSLGASAADRNHIYNPQAGPEPAPEPAPAPAPPAAKGGKARIGLIDTAINRKHAALKKAKITDHDFVGGSGARPTEHGTGIASILVGTEKGHEGLLPKGELLAASVFYQGDKGATGATTASLVAALDWMASHRIPVVNMSLAGPKNEVLGAFIARVSANGMLVVAAVGNDGPASRPLYPAAYDPVVAVTAVDRKSQIYRWANRGPQVDVAAWGVNSVVARDKGGYEEESGTSFAAPVVAAAIAQLIANGASSTSAALQKLISSAEDLGPAGRDDTYGYGLVRPFGQ